jgi:hypothetical protein
MIVFTNPGIIDTDAAFTLGVNVKESENPIGHFGTGLKFAIATILRNNGSIIIWRSNDERIVLSAQPKVIRGKDFGIVNAQHFYADGPGDPYALGFTTDLGKGWQPWMAFRELACNALDEAGKFYSTMGEPDPQAGTTIVVTGGGIEDAYNDRQGILAEGEPLYADERFEVRPGETNFIYYRGVRIGQLPRTMTHRYNLLSKIDLTEDRTFKYQWEVLDKLGGALMQCDDPKVVDRALTCGENYLEHHLTLPGYVVPAPVFKEAARNLRSDLSHGANANPAAKELARQHRLAELGPDSSVQLEPHHQQMMDRSIAALLVAGFDVTSYEITVVDDLGPDRLGMAKEGRIFIAMRAFQRGSREVAATLLEEYAHLRTGHGDATLGLQNWLFDQLLDQIEARQGQPA